MAGPILGLFGRLIATSIADAVMDKFREDLGDKFEEIEIPVSSSCIRSIGYRSGDIITVNFIRGGEYHYEGSKDLFMAFAAAPSKGGFFNSHFA